MRCLDCLTPLPAGARFCPNCQHPVLQQGSGKPAAMPAPRPLPTPSVVPSPGPASTPLPARPRRGMPTAVVLVICLMGGALVGSLVLGVVILKFRSPVVPIGPVDRPIIQENRKPQENPPPPLDQQTQQPPQRDEQAQRDQAAREQQVREQRAVEEQNRLRTEQEARAAAAARQRSEQQRVEQQRVPPQRPTPPRSERPAAEPPRSASTLPPPPPPPPPPAWTGPDSGQFDYSGPPVPQNGEVIFEPLPPGRVLLNYDQGKWSATLEPLGNGTQRLVMRSLKAGNQKKLRVRWAR